MQQANPLSCCADSHLHGPSYCSNTLDHSNGVTAAEIVPAPTRRGSPHLVSIRASNATGADDEAWTVTVLVDPPVGGLNCDGALSVSDIGPFVDLVTTPWRDGGGFAGSCDAESQPVPAMRSAVSAPAGCRGTHNLSIRRGDFGRRHPLDCGRRRVACSTCIPRAGEGVHPRGMPAHAWPGERRRSIPPFLRIAWTRALRLAYKKSI